MSHYFRVKWDYTFVLPNASFQIILGNCLFFMLVFTLETWSTELYKLYKIRDKCIWLYFLDIDNGLVFSDSFLEVNASWSNSAPSFLHNTATVNTFFKIFVYKWILMWPASYFLAWNLKRISHWTKIEKIINEKPHFLCSVSIIVAIYRAFWSTFKSKLKK